MDRLPKCMSLVCIALLLSACGGDGDNVTDNNPSPFSRKGQNVPEKCGAFVSTFIIKDRMQQPVSSFTAGEPVTFEMRITNSSSNNMEIGSGTDCTQGFYVTDRNDNLVWFSGDGVACTLQYIYNPLKPGESLSFTRQWNQTARNGQPVPVGQYTAHTADSTECGAALEKSAPLNVQ